MSYHRHSPPANAMEHRRLNVTEAAEYSGISVSTMNKYRVFGGGSTYQKIGRRVVYELVELDKWLSTKRRNNTSDLGLEK